MTEAARTPLSLRQLVDNTVGRFRSRTLDDSGFQAYTLAHAVLAEIQGSGVSPQQLVEVTLKTSCCDEEYRERLKSESSGSNNPDLILAAKLILAEITHTRPEVKGEEAERIERYRLVI